MSVAIPGQYISSIYKYTEDENSNSQVQKYIAGRGTTVANIKVPENNKFSSIPVIVATILGKIVIRELKPSANSITGGGADNIKSFIVSVVPKSNSYLESAEDIEGTNISINLPQENDVVLVRITKINPRQAFAEILSVESHGNVIKDSGIGSNGELAHQLMAAGGGSQNLSSHTTIASSQSTAMNAQAIDLGETFKGIIRSQDVRLTERDKVKIIECFKPGDIVRAVVISLGDGSNYYLSTAKDDLGVVFAKSEGGSGGLMYALDWQHMICESSGIIEKRKCAKPFV